jgi:hypothetical protein
MQCLATAMTAGAAATGMRAWIASHTPHWMTPRRLKITTAAILAVGVLAAGSHITSTPSPARRSQAKLSQRTEDKATASPDKP